MFEATEQGILVKPVKIEDLTRKPEWKKKIEAALADAQAGRGTLYDNTDEFMTALEHNFKKKTRRTK